MVLIRLAYAADLPDPGELLKRLKDGEGSVSAGTNAAVREGSRSPEPVALRAIAGGAPMMAAAPLPQAVPHEQAAPNYRAVASLQELEAVLQNAGHLVLASQVYSYAHPIKLEPGLLEIRMDPAASSSIELDMRRALKDVTDGQLTVKFGMAPGGPTLAQQAAAGQQALKDEAAQHPVVAQVMALFPGAVLRIRDEE
jgi:DNA polymerase-3 subunit gamma/tau